MVFLFLVSPGSDKGEILDMFVNVILSNTILHEENMNPLHAKFFWVVYHFLDDIRPKKIGGVCGGAIQFNIRNIMHDSY